MPNAPEIDDFPQAFDQAFDLWCRYFELDASKYPDWRMRASLVADEARFKACGLIPDDLPKFYNGYTRGHECWLYNQTSPYYRRHLLLHEGVHGFMFSLIGGKAPPWYIEGMAELLGTHHWENGQLELPYFPKNPTETPKLERIDIIQHDFAKHQARQLGSVMAFGGSDYFHVEPYGWSWALAAFLNGHPRYRDRFHKLPPLLHQSGDFTAKLRSFVRRRFAATCRRMASFRGRHCVRVRFRADSNRFHDRRAAGRQQCKCGGAGRSRLAK